MEKTSKLIAAPVAWRAVAYVLMIAFVVLTIFPLFWLGYSSLKPHAEIIQHPMALPRSPSFDNYVNAWTEGKLDLAMMNSFIYTTVATVSTLFLALAASFGVTKFPYKSRKFFIGAFSLGLMITMHAVIVPLFLVEVKLHLVNTRIGVIIPFIAFNLPMSILIGVSYVRGIPDAIIESAEIDGAKYRWIFWRIIFPLCTPVVATIVILAFLQHWNEFLFVFVFTTKAAMKSLPVAITQFAGRLNFEYGLQYASLVIGILPMIIFYIIFHAQLIKGFGEGSLKE
jgi:raffinose/stachyose/melibiose transport system permease protein